MLFEGLLKVSVAETTSSFICKNLSKMEACFLLKTQEEIKARITIRAYIYHRPGRNCCLVSVIWGCTMCNAKDGPLDSF